MSGSVFGKSFRISTWGESHGRSLGVVIDGCPAGIPLSEEDLLKDLARRKPGVREFSTARSESDAPEIMSGVFQGLTTGTPIAVMIRNTDERSGDYSNIKDSFRPGHGDFGYWSKYGLRDYRGGGRSSGRETVARVAAGAVAKKILALIGAEVFAYTLEIGGVRAERFDLTERDKNPLCFPDKIAAEKASAYLSECVKKGDTAGGIVECVATGIPAGLGEPVFDKLDAALGAAVLSIGAVKGVEFGAGFAAARMTGSENNDGFITKDGKTGKATNNSGGILAGISDGSPIVLRAAMKPTPSISIPQKTVDTKGSEVEIQIKGRHDPVIVPRAVVVVEAMTAVTLADFLLRAMGGKASDIERFFR